MRSSGSHTVKANVKNQFELSGGEMGFTNEFNRRPAKSRLPPPGEPKLILRTVLLD